MAKDREKDKQSNDMLVAEFLAKGGKIQKMPSGMRSDPEDIKTAWGKPKAKPKKQED
jgi:hypothetical protein